MSKVTSTEAIHILAVLLAKHKSMFKALKHFPKYVKDNEQSRLIEKYFTPKDYKIPEFVVNVKSNVVVETTVVIVNT